MNFKRISGNRWSCCLRTFKGLFLDLLLLRFVEFEPQIDMANKSASICSLVRENENLLENIIFFFCALSFGGGTNSDPNPKRVSWRSELSFSSKVLPSADSTFVGTFTSWKLLDATLSSVSFLLSELNFDTILGRLHVVDVALWWQWDSFVIESLLLPEVELETDDKSAWVYLREVISESWMLGWISVAVGSILTAATSSCLKCIMWWQ